MKSIAILALLSLASAEDVKQADLKNFVDEETAPVMEFDQKEVENLGSKMEDGAEDMTIVYNSNYKSYYDTTYGRYYNPEYINYTYGYTYYTYTNKPTNTKPTCSYACFLEG